MFMCPLCRCEWVLVSKLCTDCDRVRHLYSIYDKKVIMEILDKTLVVQKFKDDENYIKDSKTGKWIIKNETPKLEDKK